MLVNDKRKEKHKMQILKKYYKKFVVVIACFMLFYAAGLSFANGRSINASAQIVESGYVLSETNVDDSSINQEEAQPELTQNEINNINDIIEADILSQPVAQTNSVNTTEIETSFNYNGYDAKNLLPFKKYAESLGYNFTDGSTAELLAQNYQQLYQDAMTQGVIVPLKNDILLSGIESQMTSIMIQDKPVISPMWLAGDDYNNDNNKTHQRLAKKAYDYIDDLYPNVFPSGSEELIRYADFPDNNQYESEYRNNMHFYHGINKDNYMRGIVGGGQTAKTRFMHHYNMALVLYGIGDKTEAYRSLGKALHYISDLSTPVHTGDQLPDAMIPIAIALGPIGLAGIAIYIADMIGNHMLFESIANDNTATFLEEYNVSENLSSYSLSQMVETITSFSYNYYFDVGIPELTAINGYDVAKTTVRYAVNACASVLKKFAETVSSSSSGLYKFLELSVVKSYYFFPAFWQWDMKFTNPNPFDVTLEYNSKLCFQNDAMNYTNWSDYKTTPIPASTTGNNSKTVFIDFNGTAGNVAGFISGQVGDISFKLITCAKDLKYSGGVGSCTVQKSIIVV